MDNGLLFHGQPGTGKTHLAVGIALELIREKGARVLFWEQRELLKALQSTFDAQAVVRESQVLGPVLDAEVLILDDLGAGRTTPWARDVMHDVISHRYNEKRLLILTTNLSMEDAEARRRSGRKSTLDSPLSLRERLGDALMSRLLEMCRDLPMKSKDFRVHIRHAEHHS